MEQQSSTNTKDIEQLVTHSFAENNGVKIHYASMGQGPLVVLLHGFPDFWYTWRYQMPALAEHYRVVAPDLRGYNLSDKPEGGTPYSMRYLIGDVAAVIKNEGQQQAIIIGHDWGGAISWQFAMHLPEMTSKLGILNLIHPYNLMRELVHNPEQRANSQYARNFQQEEAENRPFSFGSASSEQNQKTPAEIFTDMIGVHDPQDRARYIEALSRSDLRAMLEYYKQNYPREPYQEYTGPIVKIKAPTLVIHGLKDWALLAAGLNGTWNLVEQPLTLVTIPQAGHFVQQDTPELVTRTILNWLA